MGKSFKPNPDTSAVTTAAAETGVLLSAFDKSPSAEYFAIITHSLDRHRLRIFNVRSGTVSNDFSSEKKERFTCLTWGDIPDDADLGQVNGVNGSKKRKTRTTTKVVALGTQSGTIVIYSIAHGSIMKRLASAHTMPVTDFVLNRSGTKGYSVSEDNYIVEWDIEEEKEISKWKAIEKNVRRLKLSHDETKLAMAGHTISLWSFAERSVFKKFTGHASMVKELAFSREDDVLISIAEGDRYINVWDAQSTNDNTNNLTALTLENNAAHIDFSEWEQSVLAVSEDGLVSIWQNASSPGLPSGTKSRRKVARTMTRQPESNIRVVSEQSESVTIPILSATFVEDNDGKSIMIARGSSVKPSFEVVRYFNETSGTILDDIVLTRKHVTNLLIDEESVAANNLKTSRKSYNESSIKVIGHNEFAMNAPTVADDTEADEEQEPSLGQKLQELSVTEAPPKESHKPTQKPAAVVAASAGSLQQVLVQALHSNDKKLLETCLRNSAPETIHTTVQRLPTAYVIPLLTKLIEKFEEKPGRAPVLLEWIKAVLLIHTAYLMTVPDLISKLSAFYQALDTRLAVFPKLLALRGRLDLIQSQIRRRSQKATQLDNLDQGAMMYFEEDSDVEAEAPQTESDADADAGEILSEQEEEEDEEMEEADDVDDDYESDNDDDDEGSDQD